MGLFDFLLSKNNRDPSVSINLDGEKKIFISFAIEDKQYRDFLIAQSKNKRSPFSFLDMSVKKKWQEEVWKRNCRKKIRDCDGVIVLLSRKTYHAGGVRWEMKCALQEEVPMVGMHIKKKELQRGSIPPELDNCEIIDWCWDDIEEFISNL